MALIGPGKLNIWKEETSVNFAPGELSCHRLRALVQDHSKGQKWSLEELSPKPILLGFHHLDTNEISPRSENSDVFSSPWGRVGPRY